MELEMSNEAPDRIQQIAEPEVAEDALSQVTGGALSDGVLVAATTATGTAVGAFSGVGLAAASDAKKPGIGAAGGATIGGTAAALGSVIYTRGRATRNAENAVEMGRR